MTERPTLQELLAEWNSKAEPFSDYNVASALRALLPEDRSLGVSDELQAEIMAFEFCENYSHEESGWGTYYGPMMAGKLDDGSRWASPDIKQITPEILDYWGKRAKEATHPILKYRYASLVWDFHRHVTGESADAEMARIAVDASVEIAARRSEEHANCTFEKLRHALALALRMKDSERVAQIRDTIISFEDRVAEDDKLGLWGYAYDLILTHKKIPLADNQKSRIVSDLEDRLERISTAKGEDGGDPWAAEAAAVRLAKYYRSQGQQEDVRRVLRKYGQAFQALAEQANAMQASGWLQQVHQVYRDFGLTEEADEILVKLREVGPKTNAEMATISHEMKITAEEMKNYVEAMIEGDIDTALQRIVAYHIPRRQETEKQIRDLASNAPMMFLFTTQLQDYQGRPVASIGGIEDDLEGRVVLQTSQNIGLSGVFLHQVMIGLIGKFEFTSEKILEYLFQSPVFDDTKRIAIEAGVRAYLAGDPLVAIHLLVPQIEDAVRNLVQLMGGNVLRQGRRGGLDLKTLDQLLRDPRILSVFGDDVALYFRVLLTDNRGMNLRNNVCHGITPPEALGMGHADRLMHVLLVLAQVRQAPDDTQDEG